MSLNQFKLTLSTLDNLGVASLSTSRESLGKWACPSCIAPKFLQWGILNLYSANWPYRSNIKQFWSNGNWCRQNRNPSSSGAKYSSSGSSVAELGWAWLSCSAQPTFSVIIFIHTAWVRSLPQTLSQSWERLATPDFILEYFFKILDKKKKKKKRKKKKKKGRKTPDHTYHYFSFYHYTDLSKSSFLSI